jgi:hypothetical protein
MTYRRCDDCGFVAAGGPHSVVGVCPRCRPRGRIVRLTQVKRVSLPLGHLRGHAPPSFGAEPFPHLIARNGSEGGSKRADHGR